MSDFDMCYHYVWNNINTLCQSMWTGNAYGRESVSVVELRVVLALQKGYSL